MDVDVIVIGGGHAGVEAAWAATRLGCRTALVTMSAAAIARMSCNPAIGGQAKGQMVREIDALGGVMGLATDATGIQFRLLNRSQGPAVWGPRAQCDKAKYSAWVGQRLLALGGEGGKPPVADAPGSFDASGWRGGGLRVVEGTVERLLDDGQRVVGVELALAGGGTQTLWAPAVAVTTGTFLRALMHTGERQTPGGRVGESAALGLSAELLRLGLRLGRLKTGTPPRVRSATVDWAECEPQPGDDPPTPFSFVSPGIPMPQVFCHITHTNAAAHDLIRANLSRAPMFSGQIASVGPRYCPSIEDKVVKFADKPSHHVFLEPEGLDTDWVYCNGVSTSLPQDVQADVLRHIPGLRRAEVAQWGYAVEYDYVPPDQVGLDLQVKRLRGLFLAGQINGTSGYEEAAGQGLLAGVNAARWAAACRGAPSQALGQEAWAQSPSVQQQQGPHWPAPLPQPQPFILRRDQAFLGVMVDDLVTRPPVEPYRMFTSRAERRLSLRSDNADQRLTPLGREAGLVDDARWAVFERKQRQIIALTELCQRARLQGKALWDRLRSPGSALAQLLEALPASDRQALGVVGAEAVEAVQIAAAYEGYLRLEAQQAARLQAMEDKPIPHGFDFARVTGLATEARQRLQAVSPMTLGQASRVSGITPADVTVILLALEGRRRG